MSRTLVLEIVHLDCRNLGYTASNSPWLQVSYFSAGESIVDLSKVVVDEMQSAAVLADSETDEGEDQFADVEVRDVPKGLLVTGAAIVRPRCGGKQVLFCWVVLLGWS